MVIVMFLFGGMGMCVCMGGGGEQLLHIPVTSDLGMVPGYLRLVDFGVEIKPACELLCC